MATTTGMKASSLWSDLPRLHKLGSYTLVGVAFLALWLGQAFSPIIAAPCLIFGALSWFWEAPRVDPARYNPVWTGVTVLFILLCLYLGFATSLGFVSIGVYFVLYLTVAKLFQRARLIDYSQILALSFLLIAAATAFNEDITFGAIFGVYVVVGVITFAVGHLRSELEQAAERGARRPTQLFGGQYMSVLVGMALLTFVAAVVFFFLFPRLGFGFFAKKTRPAVQQSGFSESVDLGSHGTIKTDNTVVMRVQFPKQRPPSEEMYWRGISFDLYDGVKWERTLDEERPLQPNDNWDFHLFRYSAQVEAELVPQEIYLEPLGSNVMFAMDRTFKLGLADKDKNTPAWMRSKGLTRSETGDLRYHRRDQIGYLYRAGSLLVQPPAQRLREVDRETVMQLLSRDHRPLHKHTHQPQRYKTAYLQLPDGIDPQIKALAEQVTEGAANDYDRAMLIANHLKFNYAYTTDLPDPGGRPPLSAFLFDSKRGHCEYFATAMVIMLRTLGIPARNVNGFYGGQWNDFDAYLAVRNADAHSWVEVALGEAVGRDRVQLHWQRFDPTPSAANMSAQTRWYDPLAKFYDSLRFKWFKYVIEYDLETQIEFLRSAGRALGASESALNNNTMSYKFVDILISIKRNFVPSFFVLLLSILGMVAIRIREPKPLDKWDALVVVTIMSTSFALVAGFWRPSAGQIARVYAVATPALMMGWAIFRRVQPKRGGRRVRLQGIVKLYSALRSLLVQHGVPIRPADGPEQVLEHVRQHKPSLVERATIERIILRYMDVRFGGQELPVEEERALNKALRGLTKALRKSARNA